MGLISIIIPVYNVEKYLDRCIKSIIGQTYKEIEIILVDDGSTDNSGKMCDEWAKKDKRIKVIHKKNAGLGYARNSGLEVASGEYIMFVDSDDYIALSTCEKALKNIKKNNSDICYYGHIDDYNGKTIQNDAVPNKLLYHGNEVIDEFMADSIAQSDKKTDLPFVIMSAGSVMYSAELLNKNNIRFYSEREYVNEDLLFRIDVCICSERVSVINEKFYYYCHNGTSLTTSYRKDRLEASVRIYEKLMKLPEKYLDCSDIRLRCIRSFMNNIIVCLKQEVLYKDKLGKKRVRKNIKRICSNSAVREALAEYPVSNLPIKQRLLFMGIKSRNIFMTELLVKIRLRNSTQYS
ncbi:MAG: glycosyltransferase [bacterium]|nr:glycosyltransferase [bacterium]